MAASHDQGAVELTERGVSVRVDGGATLTIANPMRQNLTGRAPDGQQQQQPEQQQRPAMQPEQPPVLLAASSAAARLPSCLTRWLRAHGPSGPFTMFLLLLVLLPVGFVVHVHFDDIGIPFTLLNEIQSEVTDPNARITRVGVGEGRIRVLLPAQVIVGLLCGATSIAVVANIVRLGRSLGPPPHAAAAAAAATAATAADGKPGGARRFRLVRAFFWGDAWVWKPGSKYYTYNVAAAQFLEEILQWAALVRYAASGVPVGVLVLLTCIIFSKSLALLFMASPREVVQIQVPFLMDTVGDILFVFFPFIAYSAATSAANADAASAAASNFSEYSILLVPEISVSLIKNLVVEGDKSVPEDLFNLCILFVPMWLCIPRITRHQLYVMRSRVGGAAAADPGSSSSSSSLSLSAEKPPTTMTTATITTTAETRADRASRLRSFFSKMPPPSTKTLPLPRWAAALHFVLATALFILVLAQLVSGPGKTGLSTCDSPLGGARRHCILPAHPVLFDQWDASTATCRCASMVIVCGDEEGNTFTSLADVSPTTMRSLYISKCRGGSNSSAATAATWGRTTDQRLMTFQRLSALFVENCALESLPMLHDVSLLSITGNPLTQFELSSASAPNLKFLSLERNGLTSLPPGLGSLSRLRSLDVSDNELDELPSSMAELVSIEFLDCSNNNISSVSALRRMKRLKFVDFHMNSVDDVSDLADLASHVQFANFRRNKIKDLSTFGRFNKLQTLICGSNELKHLPVMSGAGSSLSFLDVSDNRVTRISNLTSMTSLRTVHAAQNSIADLIPLEGLAKTLTDLDLSSNHVTDATAIWQVLEAGNLQRLKLDGNHLTSIAPPLHHRNDHEVALTLLSVSANPLTSLPVTLAEFFTQLKVLDISNTTMTDVKALSEFDTQQLDVHGCHSACPLCSSLRQEYCRYLWRKVTSLSGTDASLPRARCVAPLDQVTGGPLLLQKERYAERSGITGEEADYVLEPSCCSTYEPQGPMCPFPDNDPGIPSGGDTTGIEGGIPSGEADDPGSRDPGTFMVIEDEPIGDPDRAACLQVVTPLLLTILATGATSLHYT